MALCLTSLKKEYDKHLIELLVKGYSESTISAYKIEMTRFFEFCKKKRSRTYKLIAQRFVQEDFMFRPGRIGIFCGAYNAFSKYLETLEIPCKFGLLSYPKMREPKSKSYYSSKEILFKFEKLKSECETWNCIRDLAMAVFLYSTGSRISEALAFKRKDLIDNEIVVLTKCKGDKQRIVPIAQGAVKCIKTYADIIPFQKKRRNEKNGCLKTG